MSITENFQRIRESLPENVRLVVAAKQRLPEELREVIAAGATDIGENYVQETEAIHAALGELAGQVRWHLIGHLQTNKINKILPIVDTIQTVESIKKADAIDKRVSNAGKQILSVLIEVNVGEEDSKAGIDPHFENLRRLALHISELSHLQLEGLMTIGPLGGDPEDSRPYFQKTRQLFDRLNALEHPGIQLTTLSMGMTHSYGVAIEEGATMVRIGTAIFGPRSCRIPSQPS